MDRQQSRQLFVARLFLSWRVVDIPTPLNGHPPVLGGDSGNDDRAHTERGDSAVDERARQRKLAALRRFFAEVDAEVARLTKAKGRRSGHNDTPAAE